MTCGEIARILRANVDQKVRVTWDDGETEWVTVLTVDEEGFVYDRVPPDPMTSYWDQFGAILEVSPRSSCIHLAIFFEGGSSATPLQTTPAALRSRAC